VVAVLWRRIFCWEQLFYGGFIPEEQGYNTLVFERGLQAHLTRLGACICNELLPEELKMWRQGQFKRMISRQNRIE